MKNAAERELIPSVGRPNARLLTGLSLSVRNRCFCDRNVTCWPEQTLPLQVASCCSKNAVYGTFAH